MEEPLPASSPDDRTHVLAQAFDAAPNGFVLISEHGTIASVNQELCRMFGHAADSLVGRSVDTLLPPDLRYYQFLGSLTTPPCTEGVLWLVLKTPVTLSPEQLRLFSKLFPNNARPTQPLNNRVVREVQ